MSITDPYGAAPPALHITSPGAGLATRPENLNEFETVLCATVGPTRRAFAESKAALATVTESLGDMIAADDALRTSRRPEDRQIGPDGKVRYVVPPERREALSTAMSTSFTRGASHLDKAAKVLDEVGAGLQQHIDSALLDPRRNEAARAVNASEIRAHVKAMTGSERLSWVSQQIQAGDREVTSAVLNASCWTSGLEPKQIAMLREEAERVFCPVEFGQRAAVATVKERLRAAGGHYLNKYSAMVPRPNPTQARGDVAIKKLRDGGTTR